MISSHRHENLVLRQKRTNYSQYPTNSCWIPCQTSGYWFHFVAQKILRNIFKSNVPWFHHFIHFHQVARLKEDEPCIAVECKRPLMITNHHIYKSLNRTENVLALLGYYRKIFQPRKIHKFLYETVSSQDMLRTWVK